MKTSATNRRLRLLLTAINKGMLIPQPDFQRRLVWSNKDKVEFIKTVLEGYPFPEVYIAAGKVDPKTGEGSELLVDGQQRITTLHQYFKGSTDIKLPRDVPSYANLDETLQLEFLEYEVVVRDLGNKPIEEVKEIFQRINSTSYGLNAMEIHNARYNGEFKTFAETISQNKLLEDWKIFSNADIKRMNDVRYCLTMISTIMGTYFNTDKEVGSYLERYDESFELKDKYEAEINSVFVIIEQLNLPNSSRAYNKADFFTLFVEIYKAQFKLSKSIDISNTRHNIDVFYEEVSLASKEQSDDSNAEQYYKAAIQGSNSRGNRVLRGEIIQGCIA
jgi:uncharacterized protein with ParB-like and HNH nuclease domain